jgi:rhodanese-related sulfurtransferase
MDGEISTAELRERLGGESAPTVVDIRQPRAFRRGHIPDSSNIPYRELPDRVTALAAADYIVTVCPHGKSSVHAAKFIASHEETSALTVESMAGGLSEWDGAIEREFEQAEADEGPDAPF